MIKNKDNLLFFILVLFLTIIFNFQIVKSILFHNPATIPIDDGVVTEFLTETEYQNIIHFKNPFSSTKQIFYPFETNFVLQDTSLINVPFLFLLRPFFDIHVATQIIVIINIILANLLMYSLLRRFNLSYQASVIGALVFGFSPFLSYRVLGHLTYTTHYLLPLVFLIGSRLLVEKNVKQKLLVGLIWGIIWAALFYANPYYFISGIIGFLFLLIFALILLPKKAFRIIAPNIKILPIFVITFLTLLVPWLLAVNNLLGQSNLSKTNGIVRPLTLSADLISFFTPSEFNPIYKKLFVFFANKPGLLSKLSVFFENSWDRFSYPGIMIVISYLVLVIGYKKIGKEKLKIIIPIAVTGLFFAILSLGPLLKVFNKWYLVLPEEIPVYFPLPFLGLYFIPFLSSLSAPSRFITAAVFFGSILVAFVFDFLSTRVIRTKKSLFFGLILIVVILDQMYLIPNRAPATVPIKAYEMIKKEPLGTLLEIPFVTRDGLQYLGDVHAQHIMRGTLLHNHPIIGGYLSRVDPSIFDYYRAFPFIGHVAQVIDKGNFYLYKEPAGEPSLSPFTLSVADMSDEIDFLDIAFVLVKNDEKYSKLITDKLLSLGFKSSLEDGVYKLYKRPISRKEFKHVIFGARDDYLYVGKNFSGREDDFRWAIGKSATIFVKTYHVQNQQIVFEADSFNKPQKVLVYINGKSVGSVNMKTDRIKYQINTRNNLRVGLNRIDFIFSSSYKPKDIYKNNLDDRDLTVKFYSLKLN